MSETTTMSFTTTSVNTNTDSDKQKLVNISIAGGVLNIVLLIILIFVFFTINHPSDTNDESKFATGIFLITAGNIIMNIVAITTIKSINSEDKKKYNIIHGINIALNIIFVIGIIIIQKISNKITKNTSFA